MRHAQPVQTTADSVYTCIYLLLQVRCEVKVSGEWMVEEVKVRREI